MINNLDLEDMLRAWIRAVVYTTSHSMSQLDMRIWSAGIDIPNGDFIHIAIDVADPTSIDVHASHRVSELKLTGIGMSSERQSETLDQISKYWMRLKE